jgi:hypothetical protein
MEMDSTNETGYTLTITAQALAPFSNMGFTETFTTSVRATKLQTLIWSLRF